MVAQRVVPWADKIVVRLMLKARRFAETVINEENDRAEKLTGRTLVNSPIIDSAMQRVAQLEAIERLMFVENFAGQHPASPSALLRAFAAISPLPESAGDDPDEDPSVEHFAKLREAFAKFNDGRNTDDYTPVARRWPPLLVTPPPAPTEAVIPRKPHPFAVQENGDKSGIQVSDLYPKQSA